MNMKLFFDGFEDDETKTLLMNSLAYPLVREMVFKHGLRVVRHTNSGWLMCNRYGIAVGKANCTKNVGDVIEYTWRSPYYLKQRGSDRTDKETIRSTKLSTLMGVIKSKSVIPSAENMVDRKLKMLGAPQRYLRRSLGSSDKDMSLKPDDVHALLAFYFYLPGEVDSRGLSLDRNECKNLLDKYDNADKVRRMKDEKANAFFHNPFYMIGVDEFGDYLIGKIRMIPTDTNGGKAEMVEDFKRYKSIEDYPDLLAFMTMTKAIYENNHSMHGGLPIVDEYNDALNAVFFYDTRPTHYDHIYAVTPC